jgi:hypothetical protein
MTDPRVIELVMALRRQGIGDARVLDTIERIPRDVFVDKPFERAAYDNSALPIPCGQTISQPYVVAFATQALELDPKHRVLELGTGSGYQAAILSPLCRMVYTVERHKPRHPPRRRAERLGGGGAFRQNFVECGGFRSSPNPYRPVKTRGNPDCPGRRRGGCGARRFPKLNQDRQE